jgi:two-component system, OmpR family, sensor histidine kinase BaeS
MANEDERQHDAARAPAGPTPLANHDPSAVAAKPGRIGLRLALAFTVVALAAVALLAGLTAAFATADVSALAMRHREQLTSVVALAAGGAWDRRNSWAGADLSPVLDLAERTGADVQIRNRAGRPVSATPGFAAHRGSPQYSYPVKVGQQRVGQALVRFTGPGLGSADEALQTALLRAIAGAAGLAALLALLAGLGVARHITRPVAQLIAATRAMTRGERSSRVGSVRAPGELGELATAFDQMADALDRQEQLRRHLVADVAHELRTPIAVLQAEHEALLDGVAEPTPAQFGVLRDQVLRLARMVGDLETLSEADAAAVRLATGRTDLADIAAAAADSLAGRFEAAGITVARSLEPVAVVADADRLHQIIINLLTNALKFTPAGGQVTIDAGPADDRAVLRVSDTGVGIAADELPWIFDRFWRGRQAAHTGGSGIGLAVAAELARAHGGDLNAASTVGLGTQMTLTLPRASSAD